MKRLDFIIIIFCLCLIIISNNLIFIKLYKNSLNENEIEAIRLDYIDYTYDNEYHKFMKNNLYSNYIPKFKLNNNYIIDNKVCIGICVRDCEKFLNKSLKKLDKIINIFKESSVIFYENGSSDSTRGKLSKYCSKKKYCTLFYEDYDTEKYPRTVRLARGRNICLNTVKKIKPDYYIVLDFDDVISQLNTKNIIESFKIDFKWDAIFANQIKWYSIFNNQGGNYYDLWALRTYDDWMKYDCWESVKLLGKKNAVNKNFRVIPKDKNIPVISAFGGLGIYKFNSINDSFYYGYKNDTECCEHVHLHKQMTKNNKKLFIIGSMINN